MRGVLRVDAGGAQEKQFLDSVGVGLADDIALNLHIHHYEVRPVEAVCHDPAHECCREHDGIWLLLVEELLHRILVGEVELLVAAAYEVLIATALEVVPDC